MENWIYFKDNQPEENQAVIAMVEGFKGPQFLQFLYIEEGWIFARIYDFPYWNGKEWVFDSFFDDDYIVIKWMPLIFPTSYE